MSENSIHYSVFRELKSSVHHFAEAPPLTFGHLRADLVAVWLFTPGGVHVCLELQGSYCRFKLASVADLTLYFDLAHTLTLTGCLDQALLCRHLAEEALIRFLQLHFFIDVHKRFD
jgi:hypothetical protein